MTARISVQKFCNTCSKTQDQLQQQKQRGILKICGKCRVVSYCSEKCQKEDWNVHKKTCKKLDKTERRNDRKFIQLKHAVNNNFSDISNHTSNIENEFIYLCQKGTVDQVIVFLEKYKLHLQHYYLPLNKMYLIKDKDEPAKDLKIKAEVNRVIGLVLKNEQERFFPNEEKVDKKEFPETPIPEDQKVEYQKILKKEIGTLLEIFSKPIMTSRHTNPMMTSRQITSNSNRILFKQSDSENKSYIDSCKKELNSILDDIRKNS